jgi:hypothetical protein
MRTIAYFVLLALVLLSLALNGLLLAELRADREAAIEAQDPDDRSQSELEARLEAVDRALAQLQAEHEATHAVLDQVLVDQQADRDAMRYALDQGLEALEDVEDETFETTIHVQDSIPVDVTIPFRRDFNVPVHVDVPISHDLIFEETFVVPIKTPLLDLTVDVPISTTIPVSLTVPIHTDVPFTIEETFSFSTDVDIDLAIPVTIPVTDTPLPDSLGQLRTILQELQQRLSSDEE